MSLYISEEFNLETFKAWSGGADRLDEIIELGIVEEAQEYLEEMLGGLEVVTSTDVNDMLWFEMDDFIQYFDFSKALNELEAGGRLTLED